MNRLVDYRWTIALVVLGVAVLANFILTNRSIAFYRMMQIDEIASLPDAPDLEEARRDTLRGSGFMEHLRQSATPLDPRTQELEVGSVYKEAGFLGMPFYAENVSFGPTLYLDTGDGYRVSGLRPGTEKVIEEAVGRPVISQYGFTWYRHVWGWLFFPLLAFILWRWRKERHAREERQWRMAEAEA